MGKVDGNKGSGGEQQSCGEAGGKGGAGKLIRVGLGVKTKGGEARLHSSVGGGSVGDGGDCGDLNGSCASSSGSGSGGNRADGSDRGVGQLLGRQ